MQPGDLSGYEGPRTPREDEWEAVAELSRSIFFPDAATYWEAGRSWPMALHPTLRQDTLTMFGGGQPLSAALRLERDILVHGHRLRLGFVGGVCTHPDHRGRGLASTILSAMMEQFRQGGVDFAYISGARSLYFGTGANHVAVATQFALRMNEVQEDSLGVGLRSATSDDIDWLVAIAERESVRFIRPRSDFELIIENEHCGGEQCAFHLIELNGVPVGYLLLSGEIGRDDRVRVFEFAGDRLCIRAALGTILQEMGDGASLEVYAPRGDLLIDLLQSAGARGELVKTSGTMKAVDFCQTMRKLVPYFQERLPGWSGLDLDVASGKERYLAWNEEGTLQLEGESNMLWALLGRPPGVQSKGVLATGRFRELVEKSLPIPVPPLYLNLI